MLSQFQHNQNHNLDSNNLETSEVTKCYRGMTNNIHISTYIVKQYIERKTAYIRHDCQHYDKLQNN